MAGRLVFLNQPFVDGWAWRQADVGMIARNFWRHGFNLLKPQIDWGGTHPGYVGTEFPLMPYLAALLYPLFGVQEWIGRGVAVMFFALSLPSFYRLCRTLFGQSAAGWALFLYGAAPLCIAASRSFMPDMPSLALSIIGLDFLLRAMGDPRWRTFLIAAVATSLAILIKLPAITIGLPMLYVVWRRYGLGFIREPKLWMLVAVALLPSVAWYTYAWKLSQENYPYHFFGSGGFSLESGAFYFNIAKRTARDGMTWPLATAAVAGAIIGFSPSKAGRGEGSTYGLTMQVWLLALCLFVLGAGHGNHHPWYQLPFIPPAAALGGMALDRLLRVGFLHRWQARVAATLFIVAVGCFSIAPLRNDYYPYYASERSAALALQGATPPEAVIVMADDGDPLALYYADRHGWHFVPGLEKSDHMWCSPANATDAITGLEATRAAGATHLAVTRDNFWYLDAPWFAAFGQYLREHYRQIPAGEDVVIFDLRRADSPQRHRDTEEERREIH